MRGRRRQPISEIVGTPSQQKTVKPPTHRKVSGGWIGLTGLAGLWGELALLGIGLGLLGLAVPYWMTVPSEWNWGRIAPLVRLSLLWGFAVTAGWTLLWELGRREGCTEWVDRKAWTIGMGFYQVAVGMGWIAVVWGRGSGVEWLEPPYWVWGGMILGLAVMTVVWTVGVLRNRGTGNRLVQQVLLAAPLGLFGWTLIGMGGTVGGLSCGIVQAAAQAVAVQGIWTWWVSLIVLGVWAAEWDHGTGDRSEAYRWVFWLVVGIGPLGALGREWGGPFPVWALQVGTVGRILWILPVVWVWWIGKERWNQQRNGLRVGWWIWLVWGAVTALTGVGWIRRVIRFTWAEWGLDWALLVGVLGIVFWKAGAR